MVIIWHATGRLAPVCHLYIVGCTRIWSGPAYTGQAATSMMTGTAHGLYRLRDSPISAAVAHLVQIYKLQCQNCESSSSHRLIGKIALLGWSGGGFGLGFLTGLKPAYNERTYSTQPAQSSVNWIGSLSLLLGTKVGVVAKYCLFKHVCQAQILVLVIWLRFTCPIHMSCRQYSGKLLAGLNLNEHALYCTFLL